VLYRTLATTRRAYYVTSQERSQRTTCTGGRRRYLWPHVLTGVLRRRDVPWVRLPPRARHRPARSSVEAAECSSAKDGASA